MATWITHMRIAEHFMNIDESLNCADFLVGNIAPDSGIPNENGIGFTPDKIISHYGLDGTPDGKKRGIQNFKNKYVKREHKYYKFYLGYYFHLLTDDAWRCSPRKGIKTVNGRMKLLHESLSWEEIKKDWYGQDHIFLQNNPDFIFFTMFKNIKEYPNKYLDFFPQDAFSRQVKNITNFYLTAAENAEREFPYLTKSEMDSFVNSTINSIENDLSNKIN